MLKGNRPSFGAIERFCETNDFELNEYGLKIIGENFIVCKSREKDISISFMMVDYNTNHGYIYECLYSDLKK